MRSVSFMAAGGANFIGASAYVMRFGPTTVCVDWGGGYEGCVQRAPKFSGEIHHLLLTHGHFDHVGMVPQIVRQFPNMKIYATRGTQLLAAWLWNDSMKLASIEGRPAPYSKADIDQAFRQMTTIASGDVIPLGDGLTVEAIDAGHIFGAVSFIFRYHGAKFFFSGDVSYTDQALVHGAPEFRLDSCELLVREATYLGERFPSWERRVQHLVASFMSVVERGGKVLVPALSIGRAQEVFAICHASPLFSTVPIYMLGAKETTNIYLRHVPGAHVLSDIQRVPQREEHRIFRSARPAIVIASSGMMNPGTPSYYWSRYILPDERNMLAFVSYQNPITPGGQILHRRDAGWIQLGGEVIRCAAQVKSFQLSAHMDHRDGVALERRLKPRVVAYVHGDARRIQRHIEGAPQFPRRFMPLVGEEVLL